MSVPVCRLRGGLDAEGAVIPNDLHYAFPAAAYLLPVVIFLIFLSWRLYAFRRKALRSFASPVVLQEVLVPRSRYNFWSKSAALSLAWVLAALALMDPKGNGHYPLEKPLTAGVSAKNKEKEAVVRRKAHDVIFLVDASASMDVKDTRTGASRLDYAKDIADQIISRLKGESAALYAFTSDTTKLSPLTMDYVFVRLMLRNIRINEGDIAGTDLIEAVADMRDAYFSEVTPVLKTLIILTDGEDTDIESHQGEKKELETHALLSYLNRSAENRLRVYTVGIGTAKGQEVPGVEYQGKPVTSSLDEKLLKMISAAGRGTYYFANDWTAMSLAQDLTKKIEEEETPLEEYKIKLRAGSHGEEDLVYDLYFQVPLAIAMIFVAFVVFFPETRTRKT